MAIDIAAPPAKAAPVFIPPPPPRRDTSRGEIARLRIRRVVLAVVRPLSIFVPVFLLGTFVTFALRELSGLSPAYFILGDNATPEAVARIEAEWGLDKPFLVQYTEWFLGILRGDLGVSWYNNFPVAEVLWDRALISLSIAGFALVIGVVAGTLLGVAAAAFQGSLLDRGITAFSAVISTLPPFIVGILLASVFAVTLQWFPATGYSPPANGLGPWLWFATLPAIALSVDTTADVARQLRMGLVDVYRQNYIIGARVRGLSPLRVFLVHGLRNGIGPTVAILGLKFPALLGGAVVTETVFGIAGYGRFAADSALRGDVPAVQGVLVISIVVVVLFNLLVNIVLNRLIPAGARGV